MDLRLTTLGTPSVYVGEEVLTSLPGKPISFGLLVYLGVEREATRDRLIGLFWPESPQEKARHALSQALYELRQELGDEWMESGGNLVRATEALWTDVRAFEERVEVGDGVEALKLYGGHFLEGVHLAQTHAFEDWVGGHRARLSRRHRAVVDAFIKDQQAKGDREAALDAAWKWVRLDPLDDGGQHLLIQLLAETGSRTEALAQFERYRTLLEAELSLEPLEDTLELVDAIRRFPEEFRPRHSPPPAGEDVEGPSAEAGESIEEPPTEGSVDTPPARTSSDAPPPPLDPPPSGGESWPGTPRTDLQARDAEDSGALEIPLRLRLEDELPATFQLLRPIGHGSMSEVFLAREPRLKRLVAIKVLLPHHYADPKARKRFEREAQAAARINHPNVCTVLTVGSLRDGTPYLVCPFIKGTTLGEHLKAEGRLGTEEVRRIIREMASALAAAHELGIIHRDVRPDNVLREEGTGRHFLADFGVAGVLETGDEVEPKITVTGEMLGHPAYISPEQVEGQPLTDRSDIYSLGVMAHELVTGHPPPHKTTVGGDEGVSVIPPDLGPLREYIGETDPDLTDLIARCLATEPATRPAAADIARKCEDRVRDLERRASVPQSVPKPAGNFFSLLMERRFLQIMGAYIAGGWLFIEATGEMEDRGYLPEPAYELALNTALFGFLAANILAWYHGRRGKQDMTGLEKLLLALLGLGWVVGCVVVLV